MPLTLGIKAFVFSMAAFEKRLSTVCTMAHCPLPLIYLYVACLHIHDFWLRWSYDSPRFVKSSCTVVIRSRTVVNPDES